jgi:hypothetical protein
MCKMGAGKDSQHILLAPLYTLELVPRVRIMAHIHEDISGIVVCVRVPETSTVHPDRVRA